MTTHESTPLEHPVLAQACAVMREAYERGWISTRDGNVSVAMSDRRGFLVSASGVIKHALVPSQFVFVPADPAAAGAANTALRPSGELDLHRRLQALLARRALTVLHLHPTHIVAALYAGRNLAELSADFPEVTRYTRVGPNIPALPATSTELAEACEDAFQPGSWPGPPHPWPGSPRRGRRRQDPMGGLRACGATGTHLPHRPRRRSSPHPPS
ncbi:MAG: class II aldolase/adducin family protein [Zoogloea sp.]|nr:class II aldolase/adducin family protein [Zoogloea sp.]